MAIMNRQASRLGSLQLEVDQARARQLASALVAAALYSPDKEVREYAGTLAAWVNHRRIRKWGPDNEQTQRQRGTTRRANRREVAADTRPRQVGKD